MNEKNKINVLFVNPSIGLSGDTISLGYMIESLREDIYPIVLLRERGEAYNFLQSLGVECIVYQYLYLYARTYRLWTIVTHPWRMRIFKKFLYELTCISFVKKRLRCRIIDIVHTNTAPTDIGMKLAKALKAKHVWHIRELLSPPHSNMPIIGGIDHLRKLINEADARVFVSSSCMSFWQCIPHNSWMIWDAVLGKEDACYLKDKKPYILFLSHTISEAKGISFAIRAFGMSGLAKQGIRMMIVGNLNSDYQRVLFLLANQFECGDSLEFLPEQKEVMPLFAHAMCYINPSANEGLGRTTVEAMFYGCPVIALASGGTRDLIKDGETGWLFNSEAECAELLKNVCDNDQEKIILQAQAFAIENLSVENYRQIIMGVYNAVLK